MKKFLVFSLLVFIPIFAFAEEKELKEDSVFLEVDVGIFGLALGSLEAKVEFPLFDGFIGIGPRLNFTFTDLYGLLPGNLIFINAAFETRVYPARALDQFYVYLSLGYNSMSIPANFIEEDAGSSYVQFFWGIPVLTGIGYKWVKNSFVIDTGIGVGKNFGVGTMVTDNDFREIANLLFGGIVTFAGYLTAGYQF